MYKIICHFFFLDTQHILQSHSVQQKLTVVVKVWKIWNVRWNFWILQKYTLYKNTFMTIDWLHKRLRVKHTNTESYCLQNKSLWELTFISFHILLIDYTVLEFENHKCLQNKQQTLIYINHLNRKYIFSRVTNRISSQNLKYIYVTGDYEQNQLEFYKTKKKKSWIAPKKE